MDIRKIYQYALQREYEGKRFFQENAERLNNSTAINAFKRLVNEEQRHIEYIQYQIDMLEGKPADFPEPAVPPLQTNDVFAGRASKEGIEDSIAEAMVADLPVLRMAYLIERDFAEFYEQSAAQFEGEAREVLSMLANWERSHERLFKSFHDKAFNEYLNMPWGG
jgi:rubrerythrin